MCKCALYRHYVALNTKSFNGLNAVKPELIDSFHFYFAISGVN